MLKLAYRSAPECVVRGTTTTQAKNNQAAADGGLSF